MLAGTLNAVASTPVVVIIKLVKSTQDHPKPNADDFLNSFGLWYILDRLFQAFGVIAFAPVAECHFELPLDIPNEILRASASIFRVHYDAVLLGTTRGMTLCPDLLPSFSLPLEQRPVSSELVWGMLFIVGLVIL